MDEGSRAVWGLLQGEGRSPRKSGVENSKGTWTGGYCPSDTLALKDAGLASALASGVSAIHITTKLCCLPLLPSHWQGNEDTRLHRALGWNRKTASPTAKPSAQHSAATGKGGTSAKLDDCLGRFCFIWQYGRKLRPETRLWVCL
jgi:hypothetical protein